MIRLARQVLIIATAVALGGCAARPLVRAAAEPVPPLPPSAERAYQAVAPRFDRVTTMEVVNFMSDYWRLAANPGYNASIDHLRDLLISAGFSADGPADGRARVRVDAYEHEGRGWDYQRGTLSIDGEPEPLLSRDRDHVSLAINSFSTPAGGRRARLVDVGAGASDADFDGKSIKGAVVLGDGPLGPLWQQAVRQRGATGVISTQIAPYIRPFDPAKMTEEQKDVLQWGSIPYHAAMESFGFKASWRAAARMREALARGPVTVHADIASAFYTGQNRSLIAEIPGRSRPDERIVLVAHVQEPGANDNASGAATLYGLARALLEAIQAGALAPPERTLTFMWLDETRGSREWIAAYPAEAKLVRHMFSLDMTGQDTSRTGGTFLIEKQADPTAVWPRPSDPSSEWGSGNVKPEALRGSLLNDVHVTVARRRAAETGWVVRTNPYEGGSDHTVFAQFGVPSLLNWHFTDRYYHTNQDTPDKTSPATMEHVGVTVATSAWFLASADDADARVVLEMLEDAATRRLALEREQGAGLVAAATDRQGAEQVERQVIAAWVKWYGEAFDSVLTLPAGEASDELRAAVAAARARLK
ncbi:MAG: M28 family peptidase [Acidobacteria bacterium]|nr:M28 family peptidase [Acidobacteriota bacterium]